MNFGDAVKKCFRDGLDFQGRSSRSEYWWFLLFLLAGTEVTTYLDVATSGVEYWEIGAFQAVFLLLTLLPALAVGIRRLHDLDRTGWWILFQYVPMVAVYITFLEGRIPPVVLGAFAVGLLVLLYLFVRKGTEGPNRFGPDPLDGGK